MRRGTTPLWAVLGAFLALLLTASAGQAQAPHAYVPPDFGDTADVVARMQALGWTVTETETLELEAENPYASFDVIWIVPDGGAEARSFLSDPGRLLESFAQGGGVLVVADVDGSFPGPGLAPGGVANLGLPDGGAGSVSIAAADHPLITGAGIGGVALTASDLDPAGNGGNGCLIQPADATVIAENSEGPVLVEYPLATGRVVVSLLSGPTQSYLDNLLLYLESILP